MVRTSILVAVSFVLTPLGTFACSDDGDSNDSGNGVSASTAASLEGLYQITNQLEDASGCGAGSAVEDGPGYFIAVGDKVLASQLLVVVSCVDEAECAEFAEAVRSRSTYGSFDFSFYLTEEDSPVRLSGFEATGGYSDDSEMCSDRTYTNIALDADGNGGLVLDAEVKGLEDRPIEGDACVAEPAESEREAADAPCVGHVTITGNRIGEI